MTFLDDELEKECAMDRADNGGGFDKTRTVLTFEIGGVFFSVDVNCVREILEIPEIRPMPGAPPGFLGVADVRARAVPIADISNKLGVSAEISENTRVIVFEVTKQREHVSIGIMAKKVLKVEEFAIEEIEPVPQTLNEWSSTMASGIVRGEYGSATVLDISNILSNLASDDDIH
ncbi:MAG: chemotaxis protein CheW [Pelagimonas sp.]|jgi:purine-binding chemotaxis protein CheW|nr:chemotaxis protein CheW [Pelagimonas sp.]